MITPVQKLQSIENFQDLVGDLKRIQDQKDARESARRNSGEPTKRSKNSLSFKTLRTKKDHNSDSLSE